MTFVNNGLTRLSGLICIIASIFTINACSTTSPYYAEQTTDSQENTTLGTQWGENISSPVSTVDLKRVSQTPVDLIEIHYSTQGNSGRQIQNTMLANGRIRMSIIGESGKPLPITQFSQNLYLKGYDGQRYTLRYENLSGNTYEIIATVDGLDVLNGQPGSIRHAGYVLRPNSTLTIDGFRISNQEVATFRFSSPQDAYASHTPAGDARNIGVIGTAVFELNAPRQTTPGSSSSERAFPGDQGNSQYAPPPHYNH